MKKIFLVLLLAMQCCLLSAQWNSTGNNIYNTNSGNIGIGTTDPLHKLHLTGSLLINSATFITTTAPTAAQTKTIINDSSIYIGSDSTGRIYDPGGPSGNYLANQSGLIQLVLLSNSSATEITLESIQLGTGDSLIIRKTTNGAALFAVGNGYSTTGKWILNSSNLYIYFKSNGDASTGSGFSLLFRRIYDLTSSLPDMNGVSRSLFFNTKTGAFRSGRISNATQGNYSFAAGDNAIASGINSLAIGLDVTASGGSSVALTSNAKAIGSSSVAIGYHATAQYDHATAIGEYTVASGQSSTAIGRKSIASGWYSTSIGDQNTASAYYSMALGNNTTASGESSLAFGNSSTASGDHSTAIGTGTTAEGDHAMSMGQWTDAIGQTSTAMGLSSRAEGAYSSTIGHSTISRGYGGTVIGISNNPILTSAQTSPNDATPLFIIGNGEPAGSRSNAMVVRKDGKVGIGIDVPRARLHIDGGTDASLSSSSGYLVLGDVTATNLVFDKNEIIARNNGNNNTLYLQYSGGALEIGGTAAKPGGGSWLAVSDARMKQQVKPYDEGLQQVLKINPVSYQYNSLSGYDTQREYIGVLAQDLEKVAPYMVSKFSKDKVEYYGVDNSAMTYMLINAVKELSRQNDELKARLQKLEDAALKKITNCEL